MTERAGEFLREATADDLLTLLKAVMTEVRDEVDLIDEDTRHRVSFKQLRPNVFLSVDMEEDVFIEVFESTPDEVREYVLVEFAGYRLGRAVGFGLRFKRGETLPAPE